MVGLGRAGRLAEEAQLEREDPVEQDGEPEQDRDQPEPHRDEVDRRPGAARQHRRDDERLVRPAAGGAEVEHADAGDQDHHRQQPGDEEGVGGLDRHRPAAAVRVAHRPGGADGGAGATIRLVPVGLGLVPVLLGFAIVLDRILALELRLLGEATGTTETDHSRVRLAAVVTAFIAFSGIATLVPGGSPNRAAPRPAGRASRRAGSS